jgi:hypothetical protein
LNRIESSAFSSSSLESIKSTEIPGTVRFIDCKTFRDPHGIALANVSGRGQKNEWWETRQTTGCDMQIKGEAFEIGERIVRSLEKWLRRVT